MNQKTKHSPGKKLKIIPLGGLGEIGLNCMLFEYEDEILVVDCGVMFSDLQMLGVDFVIPDMTYLQTNRDKISGYIITHAHEDHIGALPYALKNHPAPIFCTRFAQKLISSKLEEHSLLNSVDFQIIETNKQIKFKHFEVMAAPVTHSIVEAMALFIQTPVGKIVFTGDFKIDKTPYYGEPMDLSPFEKAGTEGTLLLMSDSTNVERDGHSLSEANIYRKFDKLFQNQSGLLVISVFASNIARIGQAMELAEKYKKKIILLGRSMDQNVNLAIASGYLKHAPNVLISAEELSHHDRNQLVILSTGSQGEYRSALARIANNEHRSVKITSGDTIIMSSKFIPGNEKAIGKMINSLFRLGADVLYESVEDIHVSGHANAEELRKMIDTVRPKYFIPIHGEYRHLVKHARLAKDSGIQPQNVVVAENGDVLSLSENELVILERMEENRVFIEGEGGQDVSRLVIRDRRKVAETGIVFSVLIRNSVNGKILAGPDLITKGIFDENGGLEILKGAKNSVLNLVHSADKSGKYVDLQEEIRIGLRRFFHSQTGRKPIVVPILIDI